MSKNITVNSDGQDDESVDIAVSTDIIPREVLASLVESLGFNHDLPLHLQVLESLEVDNEVKESLENAYCGVEPQPLSNYIGEEVTILGAIIWESGPYLGKDGLMKPSYYQIRLLTDIPIEKKGEIIGMVVLRSSSVTIAQHMFYAMRRRGWYLFDSPQRYRITKGQGGAHFMYNMSHNNMDKLLGKVKKNDD